MGGGNKQTIATLTAAQQRADSYQSRNSRDRQAALSNALESFRRSQGGTFLTNAYGGGLQTGSREYVMNERTRVGVNRWNVTLKGDTFTTTYHSDAEHSEQSTHTNIVDAYKWLSKRTKMK